MTDTTTKHGFGVLGVGAAACAACCAPPLIAFLAAASLGTLIGVALFGALGLTVFAMAGIAYLRRQRTHHHPEPPAPVPLSLGRKLDA
jgi:hypothetical protein